MKKFFYLLIIPFVLLTSCSKDDNSPSAKHLFYNYLDQNMNLSDIIFDETGSSFELGWLFDSSTGGKVVELGGIFPEAGTYTVTLWDASTEAVLAQTSVTATAGKLTMKKVTTVVIEANKDYVVSYNSYPGKDYYWDNPSASIYPVELNGITVYGEVETGTSSATSEFPGTSVNTTIVGIPEIGFIKNK